MHQGNVVMRGIAVSAVTAAALATLPGLAAFSASAAVAAPSLTATSADGAAFDLGEYAPGDIVVTVAGAGSTGVDDTQDLRYFWQVTPFGAGATPVRVPATGTDVVTDEIAGRDGAFEVPLPGGQPSGTYALTARLSPKDTGGGAVPATSVLTVKAGESALSLTDTDPLLIPAGTDRPVTGALRLEDGTALGARTVDLSFTTGARGSDGTPDAGVVSPVATTRRNGTFAAVLRDPAEDPQGTELGGELAASTATGASATLGVDFVGETLPVDGELAVSPLGDGTPGQALPSTVTVTAPDDTFGADPGSAPDPVEGQRVTLTLDHGFFTSGEARPSVAGQVAGDLVDQGSELTAVTDEDGEIGLLVGIGRDEAFDDDGAVTATLTATSGQDVAGSEAQWDTADTLNGVTSIELSPQTEQDAAVAPTLAGNRTYYEVFTRDQFGNPVDGQPVDLAYDGNLDDFDYDQDFVTSDLDTAGDIWVTSFEAGDLGVTGTWADAPTYTYTDDNGATESDAADAVGTTVASFYELDFAASTFTLRSSPTTSAAVGSTVSKTVRVLDQQGNPVEGYQVRFFRFGPGTSGNGDARVTRTTNARGTATYTFLGNKAGVARITAEVTDGVERRTLTSSVRFGSPVRATLTHGPGGAGADELSVTAGRAAAGARATLFRVDGDTRTRVASRRLDERGTAAFTARDRNGRDQTSYVVRLGATAATTTATSNTVRVR